MSKAVYNGDVGLDILMNSLPSDLELHHWETDHGDHYDIRVKGCWLNLFRPYVTIDYDYTGKITKIYFHTKRSVPLAHRLSKIYPKAEVITSYKVAYDEYSKLKQPKPEDAPP